MAARGSRRTDPGTRGLELVQQNDRVEAALWRRSQIDHDQDARMQLFERYESLARNIARAEFYKRKSLGFEHAEIQQLAFEGLVQAIDRFDAQLGAPFSAFARLRIRGNVLDGLAKTRESTAQYQYRQRAERDRLQSLRTGVSDAANPLQELGKLATLLAIGLMLEDHVAIDPDTIAHGDANAYETLAWAEMQQRLAGLMGNMPERERFVLVQHYHNDLSFSRIADTLGLTRGRISQVHKTALLRLRSELEKFR
jgi:RNA polymerase sigma factor FliA